MVVRKRGVKRWASGAVVIGALAITSGCGSQGTPGTVENSLPSVTGTSSSTSASVRSSTTTSTADALREYVEVSLQEFSITPAVGSVSSGEVVFDVTNDGAIEHDFVVARTDLPAGDLPVKDDRVAFGKKGPTVVGRSPTLEPATSGTFTVNLKPGRYVLLSNRPGYYKNGMYAELTVTRGPVGAG